jgi:hypothetical protein
LLAHVEQLHLVHAGALTVVNRDLEAEVVVGRPVSLNLLDSRFALVKEILVKVNTAEDKTVVQGFTSGQLVNFFESLRDNLLFDLVGRARAHGMRQLLRGAATDVRRNT